MLGEVKRFYSKIALFLWSFSFHKKSLNPEELQFINEVEVAFPIFEVNIVIIHNKILL